MAEAPPTIPKNEHTENIPAGVAWMLLTGLLFVAVTGIVRYLGSDLPAAEGAFIRYAIGLLMISPALLSIFRRKLSARYRGVQLAGRTIGESKNWHWVPR